jgi:hypothetical protein
MAKSKQPPPVAEETLDQLLDKVSNAREELVAIEVDLQKLMSLVDQLNRVLEQNELSSGQRPTPESI